ncbi:cystathionine gamma-lyase [Hyphomonas johnsonii]|uniref:Cystathionine gamma-lyase n=1 Tax=Hyphomonas johnsonii MHS-2 TaxID=1280950 RepID=A0A059FUU3_9PROT|nr:cystathionine gamma-lyase [Hyphomonas johnsonii]KCZ94455.1 cystathionine gamma-lyase [Hyphomonas johnsonii MHS-2]
MTDTLSRISRLLHHRTGRLAKGEPVSLPIMATSTFHLPGAPDGSHFYARNGNPTVETVEAEIGILEDAQVVVFPSGMAAIASVFQAVLRPGDTVLVPSDGYYNVRNLLAAQFVPMGITLRTCPTAEMAAADMAGCRLVQIETPSNPGLAVCDIATVAARARSAGALLMADNTTATPLCQQPLDLGADIVVMSDTKAMAGHSDVLCGHVATRDADLFEAIKTCRRLSGAIIGPFDAYLLHRGLETLELRLDRMNANALAVARAMQSHPAVLSVHYPGLGNDPFHQVAMRQMKGFGPIVGLTLADEASAEQFIDDCPLLSSATSFGGVHSSAERRARWGDDVPDGFVRFAAGIEPTADLVAAVTQTLDTLS